AGDLNMMCFAITLDDEMLAGSAGLQPFENVAPVLESEAQPVALDLPIESPTADERRPAKAAAIARRAVMRAIEARSRHNEDNECKSEPTERPTEDVDQCPATIDMDTKPAPEALRPEHDIADNDTAL